MDVVGPRIRLARQQSRWTLEGLAEELEVSKSALIMWETAKNRIEIEKLPRVAKALGKSVGWFFGETPEPLEPLKGEYAKAFLSLLFDQAMPGPDGATEAYRVLADQTGLDESEVESILGHRGEVGQHVLEALVRCTGIPKAEILRIGRKHVEASDYEDYEEVGYLLREAFNDVEERQKEEDNRRAEEREAAEAAAPTEANWIAALQAADAAAQRRHEELLAAIRDLAARLPEKAESLSREDALKVFETDAHGRRYEEMYAEAGEPSDEIAARKIRPIRKKN